MAENVDKKALIKTRVGLIFVVSFFVLSPVLAWMFYSGVIGDGYKAGEGKNYGELIHPARPLENFRLSGVDGKEVTRENFLSLWSFLLVTDGGCSGQCDENLHNMRQMHLALGKDAYRVQRVILAKNDDSRTQLIERYPDAKVYTVTNASEPMLSKFPGYADGVLTSISGRIYIVDPLGNLMMQYPHQADASRVLKDMRQLLKATWIRPRT